MTTQMIRIHDISTDEIIDREMNASELAQLAIDKANLDAQTQAKAQAELDKAALLAKLGLTADEAKLLLS
ncbi:hypothetical protein UFOVP480_13 [uncultured Caudovirales phage]|uniref:Uncharacterized protein n=1 Tax=uncultured Caudovirales phage TaxID=2100421 RepID=A0A6J5MEP4_9CAUD|nr:hypothetical protein UFOVP480_13 [uncultured Caudovirales phage]CAB4189717.1 hypothetical protein UFOVP1206_13 [uncultured Caudovirales phage]